MACAQTISVIYMDITLHLIMKDIFYLVKILLALLGGVQFYFSKLILTVLGFSFYRSPKKELRESEKAETGTCKKY